jgi:hypothetical protein
MKDRIIAGIPALGHLQRSGDMSNNWERVVVGEISGPGFGHRHLRMHISSQAVESTGGSEGQGLQNRDPWDMFRTGT